MAATIIQRDRLTLIRDRAGIDSAVTHDGGKTDGWYVRVATLAESAELTIASNRNELWVKANAALVANLTDIQQDTNLRTQALALAATTATFTATEASTHIRSLARAVAVLALNDVNGKRQLNALIHLVLESLTDISGT